MEQTRRQAVVFDFEHLAREKEASRAADAQALADGRMSREQLARKNVFASAERFEIDFDRAIPLR